MTSGGPVDVFVDIDALADVASDLTRLTSQLADLARSPILHLEGEAAGSEDVAEAVARFLSRWEMARGELAGKLQGARAFAQAAADAYLKTEEGLSACLAPGEGP